MVKISVKEVPNAYQAVLNSFSIEEDMVICKRIMDPTPEQAQISLKQAIHLAQEHSVKKYLVDARGTNPPRAELRKTLRGIMQHLIGHFETIVVVIDEYPSMQVSAQFLFHNHEISSKTQFEICTTIDEGKAFLAQY